MILHTTVPEELIFPYNHKEGKSERMVIYQGVPLIVEQVGAFQYQVKKIISTDPEHFLQSQIYPGAILSVWN